MFEHGQCATPVPVRAKSAMPGSSSFTQCACQTSWPTQPRSSAYSRRRHAELLAAVGDVVVVLGQVRVQRHAVAARQRRRLAHQVARDRERRAGRDARCAASRARPGRGRSRSGAACRARIASSLFDHRVGRQAALALADAHRAARGVEAHADRCARPRSVVEPAAVRDRCTGGRCWWCSPTASARPSPSGSRPAIISGVSRAQIG